jgi:uncharacterized membrane protein
MSRRRRTGTLPAGRAVPAEPARAAFSGGRLGGVDALRGGAICLMIVYHFAFDLRFYRVIAADFENDPFWLGLRAIIVSGFMALVGISLVLADRAGGAPAHFWRRIGLIGACALAVSAASWAVFPRSFIYFGILHSIAVASVLAWPFARRPGVAFGIGCGVIAAGLAWSHPAFDARYLSWIGFVTAKPVTEDYVPLAPWAGVVFVGIALGNRLADRGFGALVPLATAPGWLRWLGRHSLAVYMVHQPLLLGALGLAFGG